jgi:hypothetical protein
MAKGKRRETNEKNHTKQYRETKRSNNANLIKAWWTQEVRNALRRVTVMNSGGQDCLTLSEQVFSYIQNKIKLNNTKKLYRN